MKRLLLLIFLLLFFFKANCVFAIEDPLSKPNNKMGVHILFTSEINTAANLINSNGGDWGYVTIPIQSGDRDLEKWQEFMDNTKKLHVIPIIRLATEGDYFNTTVWRKPTKEDILDFANFLNSLEWPTKNRYIVIFNEVNRSDEWGSSLNPQEYADLLKYAISSFKSLSEDFFIISSGLDNAAPNDPGNYMNEYDYMIAMNSATPGIFTLIDGLGSHSYPNPGFRQMPYMLTSQSIDSFSFELNLAYRLSERNLPVFITETGWSKQALSENQIASYFKYAFKYVWSDKSVVAVTPFILQAGAPFSQFSLIEDTGANNAIFLSLIEIPKVIGKPSVNYGQSVHSDISSKNLPVESFPKVSQYRSFSVEKTDVIMEFLKWLLKLST